jgi:hypothetical protein
VKVRTTFLIKKSSFSHVLNLNVGSRLYRIRLNQLRIKNYELRMARSAVTSVSPFIICNSLSIIFIINLIFEQMKKIFFLMLMLLIWGTASMNAQVRIGGTADPNPSAILDLNATDAANNGDLGLALPRVELTSTGNKAPLDSHVAGMMVYNTKAAGDVTPGTYYNDGEKWIRIGSGSLISEADGVVGNEVTNATSNGGLERTGSGTADAPYTLGIANGGVTADRIANGAVTGDKINQMSATQGQVLKYNGSTWAPANPENLAYIDGNAISNAFYAVVSVNWAAGSTEGTYALPTGTQSWTFVEVITCASILVPVYHSAGKIRMWNRETEQWNAFAVGGPMKCLMRFWQ